MQIQLRPQLVCPACKRQNFLPLGRPLSPLYHRFPVGKVAISGTQVAERQIQECKSCNLRFYESVPTLEALKQLYDTQAVRERWNGDGRGQQLYQKLALANLPFQPHMPVSVLDIGCHTGSFLKVLPAEWQKAGVDINANAIAVAQTVMPEGKFWSGAFEEQPIPSSAFDLVVAWDVMEHIHDVAGFLQKVYTLLKPGGYYVFETGQFARQSAKYLGLAWYYYSLVEHTVFYSDKVVQNIVPGLGFDVVDIIETKHDITSAKLRYLKANLMAMFVTAYTMQGRVRTAHNLVARLFHKAGTVPHSNFIDHMVVVLHKR